MIGEDCCLRKVGDVDFVRIETPYNDMPFTWINIVEFRKASDLDSHVDGRIVYYYKRDLNGVYEKTHSHDRKITIVKYLKVRGMVLH